MKDRMGFDAAGSRLILLNGPSSAGKSTIAGELQRKMRLCGTDPVLLSIDDYMKIATDEEIWEDDVFEIMPEMCRDITAALRQGKWVIVDHVITSARIFSALLEAAAGFSLIKVLVTCSIGTLRKREKERGNRFAGSAETSLKYLYPKDGYDLRIDSEKTGPAVSADRILDAVVRGGAMRYPGREAQEPGFQDTQEQAGPDGTGEERKQPR